MAFDCATQTKTMEEWVKSADPAICRPCTLGPVTQWYHSELTEQGKPEMAKKLEELADGLDESSPDAMVILCKTLDTIKSEVPPELRDRLKEFDCEVQSLDPKEFAS